MSTRARLPAGQMAPGVKRRMPERLTEEAKGFQLMDISFRSFQINNGWNQVRQSGAPVKPSISMGAHRAAPLTGDPRRACLRFHLASITAQYMLLCRQAGAYRELTLWCTTTAAEWGEKHWLEATEYVADVTLIWVAGGAVGQRRGVGADGASRGWRVRRLRPPEQPRPLLVRRRPRPAVASAAPGGGQLHVLPHRRPPRPHGHLAHAFPAFLIALLITPTAAPTAIRF